MTARDEKQLQQELQQCEDTIQWYRKILDNPGVSQSAKYGFAYNTEGNKSWDVFKPANAPWKPVLDPGDGSLLRAVYSQTDDYMTIEDVAVDGADLVVTAGAGRPQLPSWSAMPST